jgi:hypothetical protein
MTICWALDMVINKCPLPSDKPVTPFFHPQLSGLIKSSRDTAKAKTATTPTITDRNIMEPIFARDGAPDVNPPAGASHLSDGGSNWLYAVTAVFAVAFVRPTPREESIPYLFLDTSLIIKECS